MASKIMRGKVVRRAVKWVGRAARAADGDPASFDSLPTSSDRNPNPRDRIPACFNPTPASSDATPARFEADIVRGRLEKVRGAPKPGRVGREHVGRRSDQAKFQSGEVGVEPKDARVGLKVMDVASDAFGFESDAPKFVSDRGQVSVRRVGV